MSFALGYGDAIRLFRANGFAETTYDLYVTYEWARAWPAEQIWRVRRVRH